jgi:hypothetical protein
VLFRPEWPLEGEPVLAKKDTAGLSFDEAEKFMT